MKFKLMSEKLPWFGGVRGGNKGVLVEDGGGNKTLQAEVLGGVESMRV